MKQGMYLKQSKDSRFKALQENCDAVEQVEYSKPFTVTEIAEKKDVLTDTLIKLSELEVELDVIKEEYREKIKPERETVEILINHLKSGARIVIEPCYKFIDREEKKVGYYNEAGELVKERPATHDEMQFTIKM